MPADRSTPPVRRIVIIAAVALSAGVVVAAGVTEAISASHGSTHGHTAVRADRDASAQHPAAARPEIQALGPGRFSPGACMAFPPTSGDRHQTVFLDAGHGGIDPGATGTTRSGAAVRESTVNLAIELDTMTLLRAGGYRVVVSRTQNTSVTRLTPADTAGGILTDLGAHADVAARDVCANLARASVLVGIYMDGGYAGQAGCLTAYDTGRPFSAANRTLATLLQHDVLTAMNARGYAIPDDRAVPDSGYGSALTSTDLAYHHLLLLGPAERGYFSTPSTMPGALIEPLYMTDPFEASVAVSETGQQTIAHGIAQAIGQFFATAS